MRASRRKALNIHVAVDPVATRDLDGHRAAQQLIPGQVDRPEPALPEDTEDLVAIDERRVGLIGPGMIFARPPIRLGRVVNLRGRFAMETPLSMREDRVKDRGDQPAQVGEPPDVVRQGRVHSGLFPGTKLAGDQGEPRIGILGEFRQQFEIALRVQGRARQPSEALIGQDTASASPVPGSPIGSPGSRRDPRARRPAAWCR